MVTKTFGKDFYSPDGALTLETEQVSDSDPSNGVHTRTHESGWTITGEVVEDYCTWVNDFTAFHPELGYVCGNFEKEVVASSEEAFQHFWQHHEPEAWDYGDI